MNILRYTRSKGYGIHSPQDFYFVTKVINGKGKTLSLRLEDYIGDRGCLYSFSLSKDSMELLSLLPKTREYDIILIFDIRENKHLWEKLIEDERTRVSYDLCSCGVLLFESRIYKKHYKCMIRRRGR